MQAAVGDELMKRYPGYAISKGERGELQEYVRRLRAGGVTMSGDAVFGGKVGGDKAAGDKIVVSTT